MMTEQLEYPIFLPAGVQHNFKFPREPILIETEKVKERLPFTVRLVQSEQDLQKAIQVRHAAYARHVPEFAESLRQAEPADLEEGVAILLAESKLDGSAIGTMRIQTNQVNPLELEHSVMLPDWLQNRSIAEATRLGVQGKEGRLVRCALSKAYFEYCQQNRIDWMLVTGRATVDRDYYRMHFEDVYPDLGYIPMKHVGNIPHRVMALQVSMVQPRWAEKNQPLYDFFFHTEHADINVSTVSGSAATITMQPPSILASSYA